MRWPFRRKVRIGKDELLGSYLYTLIRVLGDKTLSSLTPLDQAWLDRHSNS